MPIYAYKCELCGHEKDVLQKLSDAPLRTCPACGGEGMVKQLTAAGFQLKGTGWYATDFKGSGSAKPEKPTSTEGAACPACPASGNTTGAAACPVASAGAAP